MVFIGTTKQSKEAVDCRDCARNKEKLEQIKMKRLLVLCVCVLSISYLSGCHKGNSTVKPVPKEKSSFPPFLAGTWITSSPETPGWQIVLTPEGTVSSAITSYMGTEIRPNQTTKVELQYGGFSTFTAGDCPVGYDPVTRELSVVIYIEKFHTKFEDIVEDGYMKNIFSGKVSDDGKSWVPDWIELFDYGPGLQQDPNDAYNGVLPFAKVADWKKK